MKTVLLFVGLSASSVLTAQVNPPDSDANQSTPAPQPVPPYQRPVSLGRIIPNIVDDQSKIWLFPAKLNKKRNWIPVAVILGTTAALIALDSFAVAVMAVGYWLHQRAKTVASRYSSDIARKPWFVTLVRTLQSSAWRGEPS